MVANRSIAGSPFLGCRRGARGQTCASRSSSGGATRRTRRRPASGPQRSSCGNGRPRVSSVGHRAERRAVDRERPAVGAHGVGGAGDDRLDEHAPRAAGTGARARARARCAGTGNATSAPTLHLAARRARPSRGRAAGSASSSREGASPRCTRARRRTRSRGARRTSRRSSSRTVMRAGGAARAVTHGGAPGPWAGRDTAARSCPW